MRPTALLTDLDGVLRLWPKDYSSLEQAHGLPPGAVGATAFEPDLLLRAITGRICDEAWRVEVTNRLKAAYPGCRVEDAVTAWSTPAGEVNYDTLRLISQARRTCRVGLVTNATDRLHDDLRRLGLSIHFDFVVNSSEVGVAKPKPEIFARSLAQARAKPEHVVFIDDTKANVDQARQLGMLSHHFTSADSLAHFMRSVGLI